MFHQVAYVIQANLLAYIHAVLSVKLQGPCDSSAICVKISVRYIC